MLPQIAPCWLLPFLVKPLRLIPPDPIALAVPEVPVDQAALADREEDSEAPVVPVDDAVVAWVVAAVTVRL